MGKKKKKAAPKKGKEKHIWPEIAIPTIRLNKAILTRDLVDTKDPKFQALVDSIKRYGILQPVVVREGSKGMELVIGRHRLAAAKKLGHKMIPFRVTDGSTEQLLSKGLDENEVRVPLSIMDEARVLERAKKVTKASNVKLAKILGRRPHWVGDHLGLLTLPKDLRSALDDNSGEVTIGKAHELLRVHEDDRKKVVPAMRDLSQTKFREYLEAKFEGGEIRWAGGKAKPRKTQEEKAKKKPGTTSTEASTSPAKAQGPSAPVSVKGGPTVEAQIRSIESIKKAILSCEKVAKGPKKQFHLGKISMGLWVLGLPQATSLKESLAKGKPIEEPKKKAAKKAKKKKKSKK